MTSMFKNPDKTYCIRRVVGTLGFLCCLIALFNPNIDASQFNSVLMASTTLLGSTAVDAYTVLSNNKKENN